MKGLGFGYFFSLQEGQVINIYHQENSSSNWCLDMMLKLPSEDIVEVWGVD